MLLGCIADDSGGGTDLAAMLVAQGMCTVQMLGLPQGPVPPADAVVISLRSRTAPATLAVRDSLQACDALLAGGAQQILFHYAASFNSTDSGNIGPVADALLRRLQAGFAIACPAFPSLGSSVFQGHLFLGSSLLNESGMECHPATPMPDANLPRVLARQTDGAVGLLPFAMVEQGAVAIRAACAQLAERGRRYAIADAVTDAHLLAISEACAAHALVTGGSGLAMGLPENFRRQGLLPDRADADALPPPRGAMAVISGSCARATLAQIGLARGHLPTLELDLLATPDASALCAQAAAWMEGRLSEDRPVVIATSAGAERVAALRTRLGVEASDALFRDTVGGVAELLVERGVGRLAVAGGETADEVTRRLGIRSLRVGAQIDPGVPWSFAEPCGLHMALKPGPAGTRDFFLKAFE
ncbi:3-oxo-tetronate kinase [Pseudoroseomonas globiformis]|uniref:3-oxo-tetronate kinase n=1 Tax=Teichococcus globiformis TaxID=2307229 RepID=A0ABV7FZ54_9PROT